VNVQNPDELQFSIIIWHFALKKFLREISLKKHTAIGLFFKHLNDFARGKKIYLSNIKIEKIMKN